MAVLEPEWERPIFVFGGGWRTGSTLLQRLLCSHPGVLVWGESRGLVESLRGGWAAIEALQTLSTRNRADLDHEGHQAWIAVANPPFERFREATRELLLTYLARPAGERGRPRWGFKEVRCDAAAAGWLLELFPGARFVFLVRDPEACLASARGATRKERGLLHEVGGSRAFVGHWVRLTRGFLEHANTLPARLLRYEDLVAEPAATCAELARFLELDPDGFDRAVFERRMRGWKGEPRLEASDRRALRSPELREVAEALGYASAPTRAAELLGRLRAATRGGAAPRRPRAFARPAGPRGGDA